MEQVAENLLSQGALGLTTALFLYLFLQERKENDHLRDRIDKTNETRIEREKEVSEMIMSNVESLNQAMERTAGMVKDSVSLMAINQSNKG